MIRVRCARIRFPATLEADPTASADVLTVRISGCAAGVNVLCGLLDEALEEARDGAWELESLRRPDSPDLNERVCCTFLIQVNRHLTTVAEKNGHPTA